MFEYDKHYRECAQNNQPFIKARTNPVNGLYNVQIDLITCNYNMSETGKEHIKKMFESEIEFVTSSNSSQSIPCEFSIGDELSWIDSVSPAHLNSFCEDLYNLSQQHTK